jgi:hypothetical protein
MGVAPASPIPTRCAHIRRRLHHVVGPPGSVDGRQTALRPLTGQPAALKTNGKKPPAQGGTIHPEPKKRCSRFSLIPALLGRSRSVIGFFL